CDFCRNTVIEKPLLQSMRILAGIRRFWRALSISARTVGKAVRFPRSSCVYAAILTSLSIPNVFAGDSIPLSTSQQKFVNELAAKSRSAEVEHASVIAGADGWFFLSSDIRFLSVGQFWGADAAKVSRAHKPESADPIPAIVDFHDKLKRRGIELLLMPVPPKAAIYPEKIVPDVDLHGETAAPFLARFYDELRKSEIDVVHFPPVFLQNRASDHAPVFCKTDSHGLDLAVFSRHKRSRRKSARNSPGSRGRITQQNGKRPRSKGTLAILPNPIQRSPSRKKSRSERSAIKRPVRQ